ncbi:hypothetical protein [Sphingomonas sp. Leaf67]|uniref:hypothetical protein n=1 Tax=Sphingomonas sp. Leaf67 TaxID=1736230 RepID=UPI0012E1AD2F|nr:hypothetical protein [Sphingomonas sp. Leaf67]
MLAYARTLITIWTVSATPAQPIAAIPTIVAMVARPEYLVCILALLVLVWDRLFETGDDCKFVIARIWRKIAAETVRLLRRTTKFAQCKNCVPTGRAKMERYFWRAFASAMRG